MRARPQKRKMTALMASKRVRRHYRPKSEEWFYSFIPFKASAGGTAPLIPLLAMEVGGGPAEVGLVNAAGSIASMLGGLLWGKLSDRVNRRKIFLIIGFLGTSFFTFVFAISTSFLEVLITNAFYTFFLSATIPIPILLITKMFRVEDWEYEIGRFNEIGGWAWVGGMIIGLILSWFLPLRETLVILGMIGVISLPWGSKAIREIPLHIDRKILGVYAGYVIEKFRYLPNVLIHPPRLPKRAFNRFYLSTFIFWFAAMLYFTQFPVLLKLKGFSATELYMMSIGNSAISAFMYTRIGKRIGKTGALKMLKRGLLLRISSFILLGVSSQSHGYKFLVLAFISYFLAGYTWAFISISTTAIVSKNSHEKGTAIGAYNFVSSLGAISGNFASGLIVVGTNFTVNFLLATLLLMISYLLLRER